MAQKQEEIELFAFSQQLQAALEQPSSAQLLALMPHLRRCTHLQNEEREKIEALMDTPCSTWMRREVVHLCTAHQLQCPEQRPEGWCFLQKLQPEDQRWLFSFAEPITRLRKKDKARAKATWLAIAHALEEALQQRPEDMDFAPVAFSLLRNHGLQAALGSSANARLSNLARPFAFHFQAPFEQREQALRLLLQHTQGQEPENALCILLQSTREEERVLGAQFLAEQKEISLQASAMLEHALADARLGLRGYAAIALCTHQVALSNHSLGLLEAMCEASEHWECSIALRSFAVLCGDYPVDTQRWCAAMEDSDDALSVIAMEGLRLWKTDTLQDFLPTLNKQLRHTAWKRRLNAASTLEQRHTAWPTEKILPLLIQAFAQEPHERVRYHLLSAMKQIDVEHPSSVQTFEQAQEDPSWKIRLLAVKGIGHGKSIPTKRIEGLLRALEDESWEVRHAAALALGALAAHAERAIPLLHQHLHSIEEIPQVQRVCAKALRKIALFTVKALDSLKVGQDHPHPKIANVCKGLLKEWERMQEHPDA